MRGFPDPRSARETSGDPGAERLETEAKHFSHLVQDAVDVIRKQTQVIPKAAVVLGSGLGGVANRVQTQASGDIPAGAAFDTQSLPHWPLSTVPGHAGKLVLGSWRETPVVVLRGRTHRYEGYGLDRVTFSIRVMHALGAKILFLTNAVGSMNPEMGPGSLMLVRDHLNFQGSRGLLSPERLLDNATKGLNVRATQVYTPRLIKLIRSVAGEKHIRLSEGVLLGGPGPAYETASEVNTARKWGADAACMSTVTEALVGASLGLEVAAISCVTNLATGLSDTPLTHSEVTEVADRVASGLESLLRESVARS